MEPTNPVNKILQILRRDTKVTTYKFALLRGILEVLDREPFLALDGPHAAGTYPLGLLVERWIYYYFPLIRKNFPQALGERLDGVSKGIAFRPALQKAMAHYPHPEGLTAFHHEYTRGRITGSAASDFALAAAAIARTMANMPMKHLGYSAEKRHYGVVKPEKKNFQAAPCRCFNRDFLKNRFGIYTINAAYLEPLRSLGALIIGTDSILSQWAQFTAEVSGRAGRQVTQEEVLRTLSFQPSDERDVAEARASFMAILKRGEALPCVWCGKPILEKDLDVDHVIPFSLWGDNSRPNLMPSHKKENSQKRAKIPSPETIDRCRERIVRYLRLAGIPGHAARETTPSAGLPVVMDSAPIFGPDDDSRAEQWVQALKEKCRRIIDERGYEPWNP